MERHSLTDAPVLSAVQSIKTRKQNKLTGYNLCAVHCPESYPSLFVVCGSGCKQKTVVCSRSLFFFFFLAFLQRKRSS